MTKQPAPKRASGSAKLAEFDTRSTDLHGRQADEVTPHSERANQQKQPKKKPAASGEVAGALRDQVGRGKG